jgi:hypothetical protein
MGEAGRIGRRLKGSGAEDDGRRAGAVDQIGSDRVEVANVWSWFAAAM